MHIQLFLSEWLLIQMLSRKETFKQSLWEKICYPDDSASLQRVGYWDYNPAPASGKQEVTNQTGIVYNKAENIIRTQSHIYKNK